MPEMKSGRSPEGKTGVTLLIVDDDNQIGCSLVALFQRLGFNATTVSNGQSALNHLLKHTVHIVITDIFMPECDGLELLRMLRKIDPRPRVVAMTGAEHAAMPDLLRLARQLGADRTIRKPFQPEAMLQLVEEMLGEPLPRERTCV